MNMMKTAMAKVRMMRTKTKVSIVTLMLMGLMLVSALALWPQSSHASAYGIQYFSGFAANVGGQTIRIPAGQLAHWISGKGWCEFRVGWLHRRPINAFYLWIRCGSHQWKRALGV